MDRQYDRILVFRGSSIAIDESMHTIMYKHSEDKMCPFQYVILLDTRKIWREFNESFNRRRYVQIKGPTDVTDAQCQKRISLRGLLLERTSVAVFTGALKVHAERNSIETPLLQFQSNETSFIEN